MTVAIIAVSAAMLLMQVKVPNLPGAAFVIWPGLKRPRLRWTGKLAKGTSARGMLTFANIPGKIPGGAGEFAPSAFAKGFMGLH